MMRRFGVLAALALGLVAQTFAAESIAVRPGPAVGTQAAATQPVLVPLPPKLPVIVQSKPAKTGPKGEVNFLSMGDWGQNSADQKKVAEALAQYAQKVGKIQCM